MAAAASRYGATLAERARSVPTVRRNSSGSVAEVQECREVAHSLRVSLVAVSDSASVDHTRVCRVSKRQRVSHCDQRDRSSDSDAHKAIIRSPLDYAPSPSLQNGVVLSFLKKIINRLPPSWWNLLGTSATSSTQGVLSYTCTRTTVKSMRDHPSERRAASAPTKSRYAQNCTLFPKGSRSPASPAFRKTTRTLFFRHTSRPCVFAQRGLA